MTANERPSVLEVGESVHFLHPPHVWKASLHTQAQVVANDLQSDSEPTKPPPIPIVEQCCATATPDSWPPKECKCSSKQQWG